jgi:uncharacterized membrane protein (UPF0127 family)
MTPSALKISHAHSFLSRLGGLLARAPLLDDEALYLAPCSSIHTLFMRYPIDVAFVARDGRVLKLVTVAPWRAAACLRAHGVLEMRAGHAGRLGVVVGAVVDVDGSARA